MVIDAFSRRVVGWAIDSRARADLATSALARPSTPALTPPVTSPAASSTAITAARSRHGPSPTARRAGLLPSLDTVGDPYDNAIAESFSARLQVEVLNRRRWNTRIELANAIFEYIEGFP